MEIAVIVLVVLAVVGGATFAIVYAHRREVALTETWREFARRNSYRWRAASGRWYARRQARIEGESAGVPFELDRYVVSTGKSQVTFTRVRAHPPRGFADRLIVRPRQSWLGPLDTLFQGQIVDVGERAFDERMLVRCASREQARKVLDAPARERLLAFPRSLRIEAKNGEITLRWRNAEFDVRVLAAAVEIAGKLGSAAAMA